MNANTVLLETGTGNVGLTYEDLIVTGDIVWILDTGTWSIDINIIQNLILPIIYEAEFFAESGTGDIDVDIALNASIGLHIVGDTGTGTVDIFGHDPVYESGNYATANNIYTMDLDTGTGSVKVVS